MSNGKTTHEQAMQKVLTDAREKAFIRLDEVLKNSPSQTAARLHAAGELFGVVAWLFVNRGQASSEETLRVIIKTVNRVAVMDREIEAEIVASIHTQPDATQ